MMRELLYGMFYGLLIGTMIILISGKYENAIPMALLAIAVAIAGTWRKEDA